MIEKIKLKAKNIFNAKHINLPTTLQSSLKERAVYKSLMDYIWSGKETFYVPTTIETSTKKSVFEEYLEHVKQSNLSKKELMGDDKNIEEPAENSLLQQNKILGFSIAFLVVLLVIKLLYILAETIYNSIVLDGIASSSLTIEQLNNIERLGHIVSSVGFIILILPLLYKLAYYFTLKDIKGGMLRLIFMLILAFFLFLITFRVFEVIMDTLVERASKQRYNAYYVTMLKQGILNDVISYSTLIDPKSDVEEKPINQKFTVEDKVILLNLYLLLFSEENVVDKMIEKGVENIYRLRLGEYIKKDYPTQEENVLRVANRVRYFWKKYNELKIEANKKITDAKSEKAILKSYQNFMETLNNDYIKYQLEQERIAHKISFSLQGKSNKSSRTIKEEWLNSVGDISMHLDTFEEYLTDYKIKKRIITKAQNSIGISLGYEFDYSLESFTNYYLNSYDNIAKAIIKNSVEKSLYRFGIRDIKLNLDWNKFVDQPFIANLLKKRISDDNIRKHIVKLVKERNITHFYDHIYLPKVEELFKQSIYISEDQFQNEKKEVGDMAIKSLYIPPVAILFSSIFGLLNFVIFVVMSIFVIIWFLKLRKIKASIKNIVSIRFAILSSKIMLIALLIGLPFILNKNAFKEYPVIEQMKNYENDQTVQSFLNTLHVLLTYENIIYAVGKELRKHINEELLESYGIKPSSELHAQKASENAPQHHEP